MVRTTQYCFFLLIFLQYIDIVRNQCPPNIVIEPCSCTIDILPNSDRLFFNDTTSKPNQSIICKNINDSSFNLQDVFIKLSLYIDSISNSNESLTYDYNKFSLYNTTIEHLPSNVFVNITFTRLIFHNNFQLTTIDKNAFTYFKDHVETFETLNTNLSDSDTIFYILKQFQYLRFLNMQNDRLKSIPEYAFNHTYLSHIYFGFESPRRSQPIETIGNYAFYNLPNLHFLRIMSPNLEKINKYSFAQRKRYLLNDSMSDMLELYIGGEMLDSNSFPITSLNRFRNRFVFIRFYYTNITYLDETVFQPFLESNPSSLIDINQTNRQFKCHCKSAWIQKDYFQNLKQMDIRVYSYPCWDYDFAKNC